MNVHTPLSPDQGQPAAGSGPWPGHSDVVMMETRATVWYFGLHFAFST